MKERRAAMQLMNAAGSIACAPTGTSLASSSTKLITMSKDGKRARNIDGKTQAIGAVRLIKIIGSSDRDRLAEGPEALPLLPMGRLVGLGQGHPRRPRGLLLESAL